MTATPDNTAPDPQTIAELQRKLDESRAELAVRNSAYSERIAYQAAANDVLKVMSASPGNPAAGVRSDRTTGARPLRRVRRDGVPIRWHADPLARGDGCQRRPYGAARGRSDVPDGADARVALGPCDHRPTDHPHPRSRNGARAHPRLAGPDGKIRSFGPVDAQRPADRGAQPRELRARRFHRYPDRVAENLRRASGACRYLCSRRTS